MTEFQKSLYLWARGDADRLIQLETWQTSTLEAIANGLGKEVVSTSGNGVSVAFGANQTNQTFFNNLTMVIHYLKTGLPKSNVQTLLR